MSALELIETALVAGAAAGSKDVATAAVKDSYTALRDSVRRWFSAKPAAVAALEGLEVEPDVWQAEVSAALSETGAHSDPAVVLAAQELMALLDPSGTTAGKYRIDLREAQGVQVNYSSGNKQKITFER